MHCLLALSVAEFEKQDKEDEVTSLKDGNQHDLQRLLCYIQFQLGVAIVRPLIHLNHSDDDQLDRVNYYAQKQKNGKPVPEPVVCAYLIFHAQRPRHLLYMVHGPQVDNCDKPHCTQNVDLLDYSVQCEQDEYAHVVEYIQDNEKLLAVVDLLILLLLLQLALVVQIECQFEHHCNLEVVRSEHPVYCQKDRFLDCEEQVVCQVLANAVLLLVDETDDVDGVQSESYPNIAKHGKLQLERHIREGLACDDEPCDHDEAHEKNHVEDYLFQLENQIDQIFLVLQILIRSGVLSQPY